MVLYGLCLNRLKSSIRKTDINIEMYEDLPRIILEAYFLKDDEVKEIREHFNVRKPSKTLNEDLEKISKALSIHTKRKLMLEFINDKEGLCLCYYPTKK